jgi:hypothetical protein
MGGRSVAELGSTLTAPQRIGLGTVAFFIGELVAMPTFMLAVLIRFPQNWATLVHHTRLALLVMFTSAAFEVLVAAITWFVFGTLLLYWWLPAQMLRVPGLRYLVAIPLGLLSSGLLFFALLKIHRADPHTPLMHWALFWETFFFMAVATVVAMQRYPSLVRTAEQTVAAGGEFRF